MPGPWESYGSPDSASARGPWSDYHETPVSAPMSSGQHVAAAITDIPGEVAGAAKSAASDINAAFNPFSQAAKDSTEKRIKATKEGGFWGGLGEEIRSGLQVGQGIGAIPALALSPVTGLNRSVTGHLLSAAPGGGTYDESKVKADVAMMGLGARGAVKAGTFPAAGPLGVTLSAGQSTGDLSKIQFEQQAARGQLGDAAQRRAQAFVDQQKTQVAEAKDSTARALDPIGGNIVADTPQQAGALVSNEVARTRDAAKGNVDAAYATARAMPGEVNADAFNDIASAIKTDLSNRPEPIIIDDKLTPHANRALNDVETRIANLRIQNRADPQGMPPRNQIVGVDLNGIDQMRKRLSTFRRDAYGSGNAADGRAAQGVLDAFDAHIDNAVNSSAFTGDPLAIRAWNNARASHATYRSNFSAGQAEGLDRQVGNVVERILGKGNSQAAIPNDVADFIYGSSGVNPNSLNVGVAKRIKRLVGDTSTEWIATKQGLFSRLVEPPQGVTDFGPGKIAQRLNKFLNGDGIELSQVIFEPHERALLQGYADVMRKLEVPQSGANWSNTGTPVGRMLRAIGGKIGIVVGATIGHATGLPLGMGEIAGASAALGTAKVGEAMQVRQVAKQMPLIADAMARWQSVIASAARAGSPPSSRAALAAASANLEAALRPLGIDAKDIGDQPAPDNQIIKGVPGPRE